MTNGNELGYRRVLRSALRVVDASSTERKLGVTSLTSWRGERDVVHLNGFERASFACDARAAQAFFR